MRRNSSRIRKILLPVSWIWNPEMNTYGRVIFTIMASKMAEYIFFGTVAWVISSLFLAARLAVTIGGRGWHLVFISMKAIVLLVGYHYCGTLCVVTDLAAGYLMNLIYFHYAEKLRELQRE
jgi:hypothetical protein